MRKQSQILVFNVLPSFAQFIKAHHLSEFAREQLMLSKEANVPLLAYLSHLSDEELLELSVQGLTEFLGYLESNKASDYIELSLGRWKANQLKVIEKSHIVAEDIGLINYLRKKVFLKFLPLYSEDVSMILAVVEELETFYLHQESSSYNLYLNLQQEKIKEQSHFVQKITDTIPALIYVYDFASDTNVFQNNRFTDYFSSAETNEGIIDFKTRVHPSDIESFTSCRNAFFELRHEEVIRSEFRVKDSGGNFLWQRSYESIFKTSDSGEVTQLIGIAFEIEKEKIISEQLKARESQLLEAQALTEIGSYDWDLINDKSVITPQLRKILGLSEQFGLNQFLSRVHSGDRQVVASALEEALERTGIYDAEFRYCIADEEKYLWSRGVVTYEENRPVIMRGTVMDITERHKIIKRLERSEELYKQAQTLAKLGNWSWNIVTGAVLWTDELYHIFGMDAQSVEMSYERVAEFVHPEDRERRDKLLKKCVKEGVPYDLYYRAILKDGTMKILHGMGELHRDSDGNPLQLLGTIQDVTEQKRIEQELIENQLFIQKIADATPAIISLYKVETGAHRFVSRGLLNILGYDPEALMNGGYKFLDEIIHPDDLLKMIEKVQNALAVAKAKDLDEVIYEHQYRMRDTEGEYRWFHTFGTAFDRKGDGSIDHALNISIDITQRVEAEQRISQKTLELQQSNSSLEEFAHVASHDLKEPLRKISTFADRLSQVLRNSISEEAKNYLTKIFDSSRRMQQLIDDLLAVSVISAEKTYVKLPVKSIIEEAVNALEYKIEEKKAVIDIDVNHQYNMVPSQFRQLFQNLLSNSLKFSHKDRVPHIVIRSVLLKPWQIEASQVKHAASYLRITVADNGIGFPEEQNDQIFAIFQRLHSRSQYEGTGIGLAICKKIVENHGGLITAKANEEGATFTIVLPY